jgi:hypothetical protein
LIIYFGDIFYHVRTNQSFKKIFPFVLIGLGSGLTVYYYLKFMPVLEIRIIPCWVNKDNGLIILRLELINKSNVRIKKDIVLLQLLEHKIPEIGQLSEWVPFTK